jgi:hypothetical protein
MSHIDYCRDNGLLVRTWTHEGIECAMARSPMIGVNGYVRVPPDVKIPRDEEYGYITLDAPGGVNWGPDKEGWIGFDTGHAWDLWMDPDVPEDRYTRTMRQAGIDNPNTRMDLMIDDWMQIWTLEKLEAAVNHLAEQVLHVCLAQRGEVDRGEN